jgi:hypothetical protein
MRRQHYRRLAWMLGLVALIVLIIAAPAGGFF